MIGIADRAFRRFNRRDRVLANDRIEFWQTTTLPLPRHRGFDHRPTVT